ncbi:hypothetical protein [Streptacidiphilus sp. PAMC 29251]
MPFSLISLKAAIVELFETEETKVHALLAELMPLVNGFRAAVTTDVAALLDSTRQQVAQIASTVAVDLKNDVAEVRADLAEIKTLLQQANPSA